MNVTATVPQLEAIPQLSLPTGPIGLVRPRRERTGEDRDFLAAAFKVKAGGVGATALFRCLAYFASLSPRRIAYPSQKTMSGYCDMSVRQVRRVLRKLEQGGVIVCVERKGGRCSSTYALSQIGQTVPKPDILSAKERRNNAKTKALSLSADVQTQDHGSKSKASDLILVPSLSRSEEKTAPVRENVFPKQVGKYCKIRRKLGLEVNHAMETEFDRLPHHEKVRVINDLEAQETQLAYHGKIEPAPIQKPKGFQSASSFEAQRVAGCQHVPAPDLPINCDKCGAYIGKECADG